MSGLYRETWDLDVIFPGGSDSPQFKEFLTALREDLQLFQQEVNEATDDLATWEKIIVQSQELGKRLRQGGAFVSCLTAQNIKDERAKLLTGEIKNLSSMYSSILTLLDDKLLSFSDEEWERFIERDSLRDIQFHLQERRNSAKEKLSANEEKLIEALSVDGYHAWGDYYYTIVGRMEVDLEIDGEKKTYSIGQVENFTYDKRREVRKHAFEQYEKAWAKEADLFAGTLNHLAGFRLKKYEARGWDNVLKEPLQINRMKEDTLRVMWDTIEKNKPIFVKYLDRKAKLLGLEKLNFYDVHAPISENVEEISFDEAADMIVEQFATFSPKMANFAKIAFEKSWIEAENRPGKRPGGFCTSFPLSKESRIFMTFDGLTENVATLAHELGHAYHQHVMNDLPYMAQRYAMNVAETASTFAEMIIADATVKQAKSKESKIQLLEEKINRSISFFMNIHARFLFEVKFYEERKRGLVSAERLNELMVEAQKEAYCDALGEYSPYFWASKLHFHITSVSFYNFPYTFGYLFSLGIYGKALEEGTSFEDRYIDLLRDTGRMEVEDLAKKHLQEDITKSDFWQKAIDYVKKDVETFMELTNE